MTERASHRKLPISFKAQRDGPPASVHRIVICRSLVSEQSRAFVVPTGQANLGSPRQSM